MSESDFEPDCWFDLLQDLLPVVVEELVHRVRQQLILPVEQVVHVDYHLHMNISLFKASSFSNFDLQIFDHLPNLEVKVGVNNLQHLKVLNFENCQF